MVFPKYLASLWLTALVFVVYLHQGESIKCWDCNSFYDPRCGHPFDNHTIELADCDQHSREHLGDLKAAYCRKTVQRVHGKVRVIRGCGFLDSSKDDEGKPCFQRAGTNDVYVTHCSCKTDGCNGASNNQIKTGLIAGFSLLLVIKSLGRF